jgi:hypothetical protein
MNIKRIIAYLSLFDPNNKPSFGTFRYFLKGLVMKKTFAKIRIYTANYRNIIQPYVDDYIEQFYLNF